MNGISDFAEYNSHDLASDESFQSYVFSKNRVDIKFWENFIIQNPGKHADIDAAKELLMLLVFNKSSFSPSEKTVALTRLQSSIEGNDGVVTLPLPFLRKIFNYRLAKIAATLTGIVIIFSAVSILSDHFIRDTLITHHTPYGENSNIILPDSSAVVLNGNTTLSYKRGWKQENVREVWLDGEAFFDVKNTQGGANTTFVVHTPGMDVQVFGTKFNVFNRKDKANVVLNSGKVKVKVSTGSDTSYVAMVPDEAVEYSREEQTVTKKHVNAEVLTAWRNKVLVFENTPLFTITDMIEYTYGVEILFSDNVDISEKLVGTVPSGNLDVLLSVLAKSSNLTITRNENQILIGKNNALSR